MDTKAKVNAFKCCCELVEKYWKTLRVRLINEMCPTHGVVTEFTDVCSVVKPSVFINRQPMKLDSFPPSETGM